MRLLRWGNVNLKGERNVDVVIVMGSQVVFSWKAHFFSFVFSLCCPDSLCFHLPFAIFCGVFIASAFPQCISFWPPRQSRHCLFRFTQPLFQSPVWITCSWDVTILHTQTCRSITKHAAGGKGSVCMVVGGWLVILTVCKSLHNNFWKD